MRQRVIRAAISLYPRAWRRRYGDELHALVQELQQKRRLPLKFVLDLFAGAALERLQSQRRAAVGGLVVVTIVCGAVSAEILAAGYTPSGTGATRQFALPQHSCNTTVNVVLSRVEGTQEMSHRKRAVACAITAIGVGVPVVGIAAADPSSKPTPPQSPSMTSSLSSQVASVPGIVSFLESSTPKSVELDSSGKVVWVGSGNATMGGSGWSYPANGYTIAGAFEPNPGSSTDPASWPTESPAAATATASASPSA